MLQSADNTASLYLFCTRSQYDWSSSEFMTNVLHMKMPFPTSLLLYDIVRKSIIEFCLPISKLDYHPPTTIRAAEKLKNKAQRVEYQTFEHLW
ncbi:hypothetical protein G6F46_002441 [Rhizopus delemar]|uniref:Uncharacterized protein n=2 Tax=Rhizopus TaxID=4842 RepID=A0A9P7CT66_9FUNG|nr:hypothetical protein G6F36_010456 [Rhizopus arrhizus]KAG1467076.1 hypothetical protein G6F55_000049 [Rhizopus delemar]KAG1503299.1 hypothetical protein G6F54_001768 [Rhizopus delemar]KAG1515818.1 hypothetical protein G6F53_002629 [Rhizopus delemar]KAG1527223.1 hypothetical protein G6F52_001729 [Rhizopus delemar]